MAKSGKPTRSQRDTGKPSRNAPSKASAAGSRQPTVKHRKPSAIERSPPNRLLRGLRAIRAANHRNQGVELLVARTRERVAVRRGVEDIGKLIVTDVERLGGEHADRLVALVKQALSLEAAIDITNNRFDEADLPEIELDQKARSMLVRSISKLTEIELFRLASESLIGDPDLRKQCVDSFMQSRLNPTTTNKVPPTKPPMSRQELLQTALSAALDES